MRDEPHSPAVQPTGGNRTTGGWEALPTGKILLRGNLADMVFHATVTRILGVEPPPTPNRVRMGRFGPIAWLGPDEWLAEVPDGDGGGLVAELCRGLAGTHAAAVDVSDGQLVFRLSGVRARDALAKLCPFDLRPGSFGLDHCARSRLGEAPVLLMLADPLPVFRIFVARSVAGYVGPLLLKGREEFEAAPAGHG